VALCLSGSISAIAQVCLLYYIWRYSAMCGAMWRKCYRYGASVTLCVALCWRYVWRYVWHYVASVGIALYVWRYGANGVKCVGAMCGAIWLNVLALCVWRYDLLALCWCSAMPYLAHNVGAMCWRYVALYGAMALWRYVGASVLALCGANGASVGVAPTMWRYVALWR
jgi:hypothetical protein